MEIFYIKKEFPDAFEKKSRRTNETTRTEKGRRKMKNRLYQKIEVSDAKALFRITLEEKNKTSPSLQVAASLTHFPGNKKTSKTSVLPAGGRPLLRLRKKKYFCFNF